MLCTSGFMNDVTFGCSGSYDDALLSALRYVRGCLVYIFFRQSSATLGAH